MTVRNDSYIFDDDYWDRINEKEEEYGEDDDLSDLENFWGELIDELIDE